MAVAANYYQIPSQPTAAPK